MTIALALIGAYIVGSIDFAVIVGRMNGVDIRQVGSGNPGTSNVLRTLGKGPAALVLIGDTFKGVVGAAMGMVASGTADPQIHWAFAAGLAAVIGHCYPVFHRFKGGKGVATGLGVLLFTAPWAGLIVFATWALLAKVTKTASIASFSVIVLTPFLMFWQGVRGWCYLWLGLTIALVVWRHKGNIQRMINRSEQKVVT